MNNNNWFNSSNSNHSRAIQIPTDYQHSAGISNSSPKIPISPPNLFEMPKEPEKVAYSISSRERASSFLSDRIMEEERLKAKKEEKKDDDSHQSGRSSLSSDSNLNESSPDDLPELPFEFDTDEAAVVSSNPIPLNQYMQLAFFMQRSNHPAVSGLRIDDSITQLQQKNHSLHDELHQYFLSNGYNH